MRIYCQDIGIEFSIGKCAMLITRSGKIHMTERINYQIKENVERAEKKETYKYLGILEAHNIKQAETKEKKKQYLRRTRK